MRTRNSRRETEIEMSSESDSVGVREKNLEEMRGRIMAIERKRAEDRRKNLERHNALKRRLLLLEISLGADRGRAGGVSGIDSGESEREAQYQSDSSYQRSGTSMLEVVKSLLLFS